MSYLASHAVREPPALQLVQEPLALPLDFLSIDAVLVGKVSSIASASCPSLNSSQARAPVEFSEYISSD